MGCRLTLDLNRGSVLVKGTKFCLSRGSDAECRCFLYSVTVNPARDACFGLQGHFRFLFSCLPVGRLTCLENSFLRFRCTAPSLPDNFWGRQGCCIKKLHHRDADNFFSLNRCALLLLSRELTVPKATRSQEIGIKSLMSHQISSKCSDGLRHQIGVLLHLAIKT